MVVRCALHTLGKPRLLYTETELFSHFYELLSQTVGQFENFIDKCTGHFRIIRHVFFTGKVVESCESVSYLLFQIYEVRSSLQHHNRVIVSVIFTNLMQVQLKELEFNVLDSLNTKLVRTVRN